MAIGRERMLGIAHAERERLGRMIQFAEPDTWELPSAAPGWWNRDVMAHLAASDTAAAQLVAGEPAEELEEYRRELGGQFSVVGLGIERSAVDPGRTPGRSSTRGGGPRKPSWDTRHDSRTTSGGTRATRGSPETSRLRT